jgi:hypothetical protein
MKQLALRALALVVAGTILFTLDGNSGAHDGQELG